MKVTKALIHKLIELRDGATLSDSTLRGEWFLQMQEEGILVPIIHGSRKAWKARSDREFAAYLKDKHNLSNLEECLRIIDNEEVSRAEQVAATGDSKFVVQRTFKGFLVNCYEPIEAILSGTPLTICPAEGTYTFIADFENLAIPNDVVVVGIENAENFRYIAKQKAFFERQLGKDNPILFVSRYPQSQSKDLRTWLTNIPNRYVHFGDLDLAGIHIFLTEFYTHLHTRSSFLIPDDYEQRIESGSTQRYIEQYDKYGSLTPADPRLLPLVNCIHRYHRGYDQEGFIE